MKRLRNASFGVQGATLTSESYKQGMLESLVLVDLRTCRILVLPWFSGALIKTIPWPDQALSGLTFHDPAHRQQLKAGGLRGEPRILLTTVLGSLKPRICNAMLRIATANGKEGWNPKAHAGLWTTLSALGYSQQLPGTGWPSATFKNKTRYYI